MFKKIVILLFVSLVILTGCTSLSSSNKWTETVGVIHNVTELNDGKFAYTLSYQTELGRKNSSKPISQHYLGKSQKPINNQKIKMQYLTEEPIIYKLLNSIKYTQKEGLNPKK